MVWRGAAVTPHLEACSAGSQGSDTGRDHAISNSVGLIEPDC